MIAANIIKINKIAIKPLTDFALFENIKYALDNFHGHAAIYKKLHDKNPFTITIIVDCLNPKFYNNKKYVKNTKYAINSKYIELLYEHFFDEFGRYDGNILYAKWLDKYRPVWNKEKRKKEIDDYIITGELEPRYANKIIRRFKNLEKIKQPQVRTERERYYNLPTPLNHIDYRNPYDNIFVWEDENKKYCVRGGSGSSGQREINSKFIFGFALINKERSIESHLYIYNDHNKLAHVKSFDMLTVPRYDIGSNYFLSSQEKGEFLKGVNLIEWKNFAKAETITITKQK